MKNLVSFMIVFLTIFSSCSAQQKEKEGNVFGKNEPKEDIKVNKEYDEDGNLVRYDSVYTYSYSNSTNGSVQNDSLMAELRKRINSQFSFSSSNMFDDFFGSDSLMTSGFFSNDFAEKFFSQSPFLNSDDFLKQQEELNEKFRQMDSLRQKAIREEFENAKKRKTQKVL